MAFWFAHLKDGHAGQSMQWVCCRQLMTIVLTIVIFIGKCSGLEDCAVINLAMGQSSPSMQMKENLTLGIQIYSLSRHWYWHLPGRVDVFRATHFLLMSDMVALGVSFNGTHFMCSKDGLPATAGSNGTSLSWSSSDGWLHIPISLRNGSLTIQSNENVCPHVLLTGGNTVFKIAKIEFYSEIVFNCHESCPIYTVFFSLKELSLPIYVREVAAYDASATINVRVGEFRRRLDDINLTKVTNVWEKVTWNLQRNETGSLVHAELKFGKEKIWNTSRVRNFESEILKGIDDGSVVLFAYPSPNIEWAINCDPHSNESTGTTTAATNPSEVGCSLGITLPNVLLFLVTLVMFIYILRNKKFFKRQQNATQPSVHFSRGPVEDRPRIDFIEGPYNYIVPIGPNEPAQEPQPGTSYEDPGNPPSAVLPSDVTYTEEDEGYVTKDMYVELPQLLAGLRKKSPAKSCQNIDHEYANI